MEDQNQKPEKGLQSIREDLKQMGYLDGSLERWVTPDISSNAPLAKVSFLAAVRIGIIGGLILGLLMSAGTLLVEGKHLLGNITDIIIFTAYLLILFGLAFGVMGAVLVGALTASVKAFKVDLKSVSSSSSWAGWIASVMSFAYLLVWWHRNISIYSNETISFKFVLMAGVTITGVSLILGKFFSYTFNVILLRMGGLMPKEDGKKGLRTLTTVIFFALGVIIFSASAGSGDNNGKGFSAAEEARKAGINPVSVKLRVLAIDGLSYSSLNYLAGSGHIPNLELLLANSYRAKMESLHRIPPQVWISIASGKPPEKLMIAGYRSKKLKGLSSAVNIGQTNRPLYYALNTIFPSLNLAEDVPLSSIARADKTVWEIASECGFKVGQINWWASWPASPIDGFTITDRFLTRYHAKGNDGTAPFDNTLAQPESVAQMADEARQSLSYIPRLYLDRPELGMVLHDDSTLAKLGQMLLKKHSPNLFLLYLPGMDVLVRKINKGGISPEIILKFSLDLEAYAGFLDGVIANYLSGNQQEFLMLITDPGNDGKLTMDGKRQDGMFILAGPGINTLNSTNTVSSLDVAPTILYLLGLPLSDEMPGKVVEEMLESAFWSRYPIKSISTYGARKQTSMEVPGSSIDDMHMERLKSLGYIE